MCQSIGPTALFGHRLAFGKRITSFPAFKEKLSAKYVYSEERVVQDQNLITSQGNFLKIRFDFILFYLFYFLKYKFKIGPGTTFEFALKIVEYLEGSEKSKSLIEPMRLIL